MSNTYSDEDAKRVTALDLENEVDALIQENANLKERIEVLKRALNVEEGLHNTYELLVEDRNEAIRSWMDKYDRLVLKNHYGTTNEEK